MQSPQSEGSIGTHLSQLATDWDLSARPKVDQTHAKQSKLIRVITLAAQARLLSGCPLFIFNTAFKCLIFELYE